MIPARKYFDSLKYGDDENGQYIIDVLGNEAVSKITRLAMKVEVDERDKLLQETDWSELSAGRSKILLNASATFTYFL